MRQRRYGAARQIKNRKPQRTHPILDIVPKDPQRPHVADDVQPPAVQELVRQERPIIIHGKTHACRPARVRKTRWHDAKQIKDLLHRLLGQCQLEEKHNHVDQNQRTRHYRHRSARNRIQ